MTDSTGHGSVEPDPAADPANQASAQAPRFGTPTPGSIAADPVSQGGYGTQSGYQPPAGYAPGYAPQGPGHAPLSPSEERTWAMLGHLSAFLAGFFGVAFLGPLVVYLMYKDRSPFVRRHAAESLNFQISLMIYTVVGVIVGIVVSVVTIGLALIVLVPLLIVATIGVLVCMIMACVAANDGRDYRYPLNLRFVH